MPLDKLPISVLNDTDVLLMENTDITHLVGSDQLLNSIEFLDVSSNKIRYMSNGFIKHVNNSKTLKGLDLRHNSLTRIPREMMQWKSLESIWLSGNPIYCDCSMIWTIEMLNNFTTSSKSHVIVDYKEVKCHSKLMKNIPVYVLNPVAMGCYPPKLTLPQKVGIGLGSVLALLTVLTLVVVSLVARYPREIKFLIYYYLKLDTVPKDDKDENVDNMDYDAFFCYRSVYY